MLGKNSTLLHPLSPVGLSLGGYLEVVETVLALSLMSHLSSASG